MKRVLLAGTALCMGAGMAMADVTVSGDGRMGVVSNDNEEIHFNSRVRIKFAASAELDGGMTAGGSIRADNAANGAKGTAGSVYLMGSFGKLEMGDVDAAAKTAIGNVGTVGYSLLDEENNITYLRDDPDPTLLYTLPKMGIVQAYASVGQSPVEEGSDKNEVDFDTFAIGAKADLGFGDMGTAWLGAGFESARGDGDGHLVVGAGASVSGFSGKLVAGSRDDDTQFGISAGYSAGQIGTTVFYTDDTDMDGENAKEALGVGLEWSLGGGAALKTGVVTVIGQDGADDIRKADLGVTFGF